MKSPDILAIKGLAQFKQFPAVVAIGNLIEHWHISDFHISKARPEQEIGFAEHLSRERENLSHVIEYRHKNHTRTFDAILEKLKSRVPGITKLDTFGARLLQRRRSKMNFVLFLLEEGTGNCVQIKDQLLQKYKEAGCSVVANALKAPKLSEKDGKATYREAFYFSENIIINDTD